MLKTSFGFMEEIDLGFPLDSKVEVMHFSGKGKPHSHDHREVAICVSGSGVVCICYPGDNVFHSFAVNEGVAIVIGPDSKHYMIPSEGLTMKMLIAYEAPA